jgi:ElaB/YqjD/DUF883 family membrane-anchored ribosome-binding protein
VAERKDKYVGSKPWSLGIDMEDSVHEIIRAMARAMNGESDKFAKARSELKRLRKRCDQLEKLIPVEVKEE